MNMRIDGQSLINRKEINGRKAKQGDEKDGRRLGKGERRIQGGQAKR